MLKKSNNYYLGINLYQDPSAALVKDGKVLFFCEEERLIRIKHAKNFYPINAIKHCLKKESIGLEDINAISINWDIPKYTNGAIKKHYDKISQDFKIDRNTKIWQSNNLKLNSKKNYEKYHIDHLKKYFDIKKNLRFEYFPHHFIHAFQACYQSKFKSAVCISIDGSGDFSCTTVWKYQNNNLRKIKDIKIPHSLGWFYAAITEFLGFEAYDGEYKVMGLASYGNYNERLFNKLKKIIDWSEKSGDYKVDPHYLHYGKHSFSKRYTDKLPELLRIKPRKEKEKILQSHKDLAFNAQLILEECVQNIVQWAIHKTKIKNICISGGVGLNVKMNSKIFQMSLVNDVFAHPLCMDSGAAAGAALYSCYKNDKLKPEKIKTLSLGPKYSNLEIKKILLNKGIKYRFYNKKSDLHKFIAKEMSRNKIFGYFSGSIEGGPRALGNRSIIGSPSNISMRNKINKVVKYREIWRPLCPSILPEYRDEYLYKNTYAPFMIIAFKAKLKFQKIAPAVVHIDNTSRVQVTKKNSDFYKLIKEFSKITGIGAILNTSFNLKGEPIVCSPTDALKTFYSSGLDYLAIENFLIKK